MRQLVAVFALALSLSAVGCASPTGEPVQLLTGDLGCYAGGGQAVEGSLIADPQYGTRFTGQPVMWPVGFTAVRLGNGEVAVFNPDGKHIATTGKRYGIAYAFPYHQAPDMFRLADGTDSFPAAADCGYSHYFYEVR